MPYPVDGGYNKRAKEIALNSDYVYSVSKYVAETAEKRYGIKTPVMYVGVDTKVFQPAENKKEESTSKLKVLYVGSFQRRKRAYLVIEAAKRFPDIEFHLIGSGPLESSVLEAKKSLEPATFISTDVFHLKNLFPHCKKPTFFFSLLYMKAFQKLQLKRRQQVYPQ